MFDRIKTMVAGCAEIFFLRGSMFGLLLAGVLLLRPEMALTGVIAVAAACGFAWLIGMKEQYFASGHYVYNPLFVGLSIGCRFEPSWLVAMLAILGGVLALLVTVFLANALLNGLRLPILSLPFVLVTSAIYLAAAKHGDVLPAAEGSSALLALNFGLPTHLAGFIRSFGAILFMPSVLAGLGIALVVLTASRILFVLAALGYVTGVATHGLLLGSMEQSLADPNNFNYTLIAMALGGVFLVPSLASCLLALASVAIAPLVLDAYTAVAGPYSLPPLTLPFCIIVPGMLYALRLAASPLLSSGFGATPEEVRENALVDCRRYDAELRRLSLPFSGVWTVWQGFNGRWTHQGVGRYAYDFVITDEHGKTHRGDGQQLQDYFCYRMPVLAPIRGHVVRVVDHIVENPPGKVDSANNWGNLVLLKDPRGFYVEISHFAQKSIRVKEGDWVEPGAALGLCGNSGYSPQPHIHIQAQSADSLGSPTVPFTFSSFSGGDVFRSTGLPREGERIEPLYVDQRLDAATTFLLDDAYEYEVLRRNRDAGTLKFVVKIAADGTCYFQSDRGRLYFGKHDGTFYFYRCYGDDPYLRMLLTAMPRLPLADRQNLSWIDYLPAQQVLSGWRQHVARYASILWSSLAVIRVKQSFRGRQSLESEFQSPLLGLKESAQVEFDERGPTSVRFGEIELNRIQVRSGVATPRTPRQPRKRPRSRIMITTAMACAITVAVIVAPSKDTARESDVQGAIKQSLMYEGQANYSAASSALLGQLHVDAKNYTLNARLGWLAYLAGKNTQAERYYRAAIVSTPKSIEARLGCTLPLLAEAKYKEVESLTRDVIKLDPGNVLANLRLAIALRLQKRYGPAEAILKRMLHVYPAEPLFKNELSALKKSSAKVKATSDGDGSGDAEIQQAISTSLGYEYAFNYRDAIAALAKPLEKHKTNYVLNLRTGWLEYLNAQYDDAQKDYEGAETAMPDSREAKLGHMLVLLAQSDFAGVKTLAEGLLADDPLNYYGNLRLIVALRLKKEYPAAEKVAAKMLAYYPADGVFLTEMALIKEAAAAGGNTEPR